MVEREKELQEKRGLGSIVSREFGEVD